MAIIVEEGKKQSNILGMLGVVAFFGVAIAAVYYIFFAQPELAPIAPSGALDQISPLAQGVSPQALLGNTEFQGLQSTVNPLPSPTGPTPVGRSNPFLVP